MADPQGLFTYPGINQVLRARYTQTHGEVPDSITVDIVPQPVGQIAKSGTAVFSFDGMVKTLPNCAVDFATIQLNRHGHVQRLRIFDRRWTWRYGEITGQWNDRLLSGLIVPGRERRPAELCAMLLEAMGELSYDVSLVPNAGYPHVNWVCETPGRALTRLVDYLGCRTVLGFGNDPVRIVPLGSGLGAPDDDDIMSVGYGIEQGIAPRSIKICGDRILFEARFLLEPVAIEESGNLVPFGEVSYAPNLNLDDGGWGDLPAGQYDAAFFGDENSGRAKKSIWRYYRVKAMSDGTLNIPGYGVIDDIRKTFPLRDTLLNLVSNAETGNYFRPNAYVIGEHWIEQENPPVKENSDYRAVVATPFTLIGDEGVIAFSDYVYKVDNERLVDPELLLHCSFYIQNDNQQYIRYVYETQITNNLTGPKVLKLPELKRRVIAKYLEDEPSLVESVVTNDIYIDQYAEEITDVERVRYADRESYSLVYRGLKDISPTGVIRQVTFVVDCESGARTYCAVNSEVDPYVIPYEDRAMIQVVGRPANDSTSDTDNDQPAGGKEGE